MSIEKIVRPFETTVTTPPPRNSVPTPSDTPRTVILQFGKSARGRVATISYTISVERYMTKQQRENCDATGGGTGSDGIDPEFPEPLGGGPDPFIP